MAAVWGGGQRHRRTRLKGPSALGCSASADDSRRAAGNHAIGRVGQAYCQNVRGPARWTTLTRRTIHRDRDLIAYDVIRAVMHGGEDLRHTAAQIRRHDSGSRKLSDLRVVGLPRYLVRNVNRFGRVYVSAVSFVKKECGGVGGEECSVARLDIDGNQVLVPRATR